MAFSGISSETPQYSLIIVPPRWSMIAEVISRLLGRIRSSLAFTDNFFGILGVLSLLLDLNENFRKIFAALRPPPSERWCLNDCVLVSFGVTLGELVFSFWIMLGCDPNKAPSS